MIYFTSDTHVDHENSRIYCPETRGHFETTDDMNQWVVDEWNRTVTPRDTVYHLGDVAMGNTANALRYLKQLNGKLILIEGNHDEHNLKIPEFRSLWSEVHKYHEVKLLGHRFVLCHYPLLSWNRSRHGAIQLHGHLHQASSGLEQFRSFNVGWDSTKRLLTPVTDIINLMATRKIYGDNDQ